MVSNSEKVIAATGSVGPTVPAVPSEQEEAVCPVDGVQDQCPDAALHLLDQDVDEPLEGATGNYKSLDKVYATKRADSLESLAFKSMEPNAKQDANLSHSLNGCSTKVSGFPKRYVVIIIPPCICYMRRQAAEPYNYVQRHHVPLYHLYL